LSLILAGAILSIALNPLVFAAVDFLTRWVRRRPDIERRVEDARGKSLARLQLDLDAARAAALEKAAAHRTFSAKELAEKFPLFAGLTPDQREVITLHFQPLTAQPGERIIRAGDKADAMYFIAAGEVEIQVAGKRIKLGSGGFFGEMALLSGEPRSADVIALGYGKFLSLSRQDLRHLMRRYPAIREQIAALAAERGEMNRQLFEEASQASAPGF
jgi:CPA2 family monovalent cation:H+ antiporter-2